MRTSTITVRLPLKVLHEIERLSEVTKLRPSVLCAYVLQDKLRDWVHEYVENIAKELGDKY
ncbi:MAG: hypothetical protein JSU57_00495 [Candidatus Heimdallarchaeota archaeon]|nr:MAG: hypothetical protein JSU57_00495 [Candidatus Heimdallarchaeota archaeon]